MEQIACDDSDSALVTCLFDFVFCPPLNFFRGSSNAGSLRHKAIHEYSRGHQTPRWRLLDFVLQHLTVCDQDRLKHKLSIFLTTQWQCSDEKFRCFVLGMYAQLAALGHFYLRKAVRLLSSSATVTGEHKRGSADRYRRSKEHVVRQVLRALGCNASVQAPAYIADYVDLIPLKYLHVIAEQQILSLSVLAPEALLSSSNTSFEHAAFDDAYLSHLSAALSLEVGLEGTLVLQSLRQAYKYFMMEHMLSMQALCIKLAHAVRLKVLQQQQQQQQQQQD
jgi:hypothetical protein